MKIDRLLGITIYLLNHKKVNAPYYGVLGVLRLDVKSKYEEEGVLSAILGLVEKHFYKEFGVEWIVTKAIGVATKRRGILQKLGYVPMKNFALDDYYGRIESEIN